MAAGCARAPLIAAIPTGRSALAESARPRFITDYRAAAGAIAGVMVAELGLPVPDPVTLFVYPGRDQYAQGLARHGHLSSERAVQLADSSVGLGQRGKLFINDGALRGARRRRWLAIVAHELTHVSQYELSAGRRGRSEQWLREGMADWVAARVLERLGEGSFARHRDDALRGVRGVVSQPGGLDLFGLGQPLRWEQRQVLSPAGALYQQAFLLTDDLIRLHGLDRLVTYFEAFAASDDRLGHFRRVFGISLSDFEGGALRRLEAELQGSTARAAASGPEAGGSPAEDFAHRSDELGVSP